MKQFFSYLGASLAAIAALASCNKEIEAPVEDLKGGVPFEICASTADTKTAIDGLATRWVAADAINLFHAVAGTTTYISDGEFTITAENLSANKFKGTLKEELTAESYDWYAFYPYSSYNKTPAGSTQSNFGFTTIGGKAQTQTGNNSTAHLSGKPCPLYGVVKSVASNAAPTVEMNHLTSIIEVSVTNNSGEDLTVTSVSFTGTEDIAGIYYIDFTQTPVVYTPIDNSSVSKTASLSVAGGEAIAASSSAKFYIAIKPFTATTGQTLKVSVNGYEKEIPHTNDVSFNAGKIKKINFDFDKVVVDYVTLPWTEDFSGNIDIYSLVNGGTETKTYEEKLAGGTAPELLVAKNNGSFSAKVMASAGKYVLTFKSNHADYFSISVDNEDITLKKISNTEYTLVIPEGVDFFNITFTNTNSGNTRLDDISLMADERTPLTTPSVTASLNEDTPNSINVKWGAVEHAGSYVVTATPATGSAVSETVTAVESTTTYEHTISGLAYETVYTISVVAKSSDSSLYFDSAAGEAEPVTTGAKPAEVGVSWSRVTTVAELLAGGTFIIGYEATANSGEIVPMANTGSATTSAAGFIYSGSKAVSGGKDTIDMSTVSETSNYEVTIVASTSVTGAICIKLGDNYLGNTNTKNNCKLFTAEAATTAFTPTVGDNDVFTLKIAANESYHTLQYNASSPRFAVYGGAQKNVVIYKKGN